MFTVYNTSLPSPDASILDTGTQCQLHDNPFKIVLYVRNNSSVLRLCIH